VVQAAELGRLQGRQIRRKTPHQSLNLTLRNVRTLGVPIFHCPA
jgi:hypothetical protein